MFKHAIYLIAAVVVVAPLEAQAVARPPVSADTMKLERIRGARVISAEELQARRAAAEKHRATAQKQGKGEAAEKAGAERGKSGGGKDRPAVKGAADSARAKRTASPTRPPNEFLKLSVSSLPHSSRTLRS